MGPHEVNGDKFLFFTSLKASKGLSDQGEGYITAGQLPRHSQIRADHRTMITNRNFQLTDKAMAYLQTRVPDQVFMVNKPIIFVSHGSTIGDGNLWARDDAANGIFHSGAVLASVGHASTEMRVAAFSKKVAQT